MSFDGAVQGGSNAPVALAVMAKAPIPGEAKTRLGATVGHAAAAALYRAFFLDTIAVLDQLAASFSARKVIVCPDARHAQLLTGSVGDDWAIVPQRRAGLMGGIADAFEIGFTALADMVLVTDADSPLALSDHAAACLALGPSHDITIGPTLDGGYYLIAARAAARPRLADLLLGVAYESSTICTATLARAQALGLRASRGPTGFDVDTQYDLNLLAARLADFSETTFRSTRRALAVHAAQPGLLNSADATASTHLALAEGGD